MKDSNIFGSNFIRLGMNLIKIQLIRLIFLILPQFASCQQPVDKGVTDNFWVITSDSVKLYVKRLIEDKPVCIFIHGGPGAWSLSFENMNGNKLASVFSMVYYDQRGCGRSGPSGNYSLNRMALDIEEIRKGLHADKIFLLAHSFGGIIAQKYCETFQSHVQGLILLNCTLDIYNSIENQINYMGQLLARKFTANRQDEIMSVFSSAKNKLDSLGLTYKILSDNKSSDDSVNAIDRTNPSSFGFARKVWSIPEYFQDFSLGTDKVLVPVLVISGLMDHAIGPEHYKKFHYPDQKTCIINGGHLLYYEHTMELLNAIRSWINSPSFGAVGYRKGTSFGMDACQVGHF
jgi:proline iminopeptidase